MAHAKTREQRWPVFGTPSEHYVNECYRRDLTLAGTLANSIWCIGLYEDFSVNPGISSN